MKMTFSPLENALILEVIHTSQTLDYLLDKYVLAKRCSRSGFYKVIASLQKKEVIILKRRIVSINKIWIFSLKEFFERLAQGEVSPSYLARQVDHISVDEKIVYSFSSIVDIDIFILNLIYDLSIAKREENILIMEKHEFFVLLNKERTQRILKEIQKFGTAILLLVCPSQEGHRDRYIAKKYLKEPARIHIESRSREKSLLHKIFHVVGDVVIELDLDKKFCSQVDMLYSADEFSNEKFNDALIHLANEKWKHRIKIYRNSRLTKRIKNKFKKYFIL